MKYEYIARDRNGTIIKSVGSVPSINTEPPPIEIPRPVRKDPKKVAEGKKSRAAGKAFEDRGYLDLEKKGWIVSRWMKNVELEVEAKREFSYSSKTGMRKQIPHLTHTEINIKGKLVAAKPKIRMIPGKGPMLLGAWTGFPDFIAFKCKSKALRESFECWEKNPLSSELLYENIGVEFKMDGKLDKLEKEKCKWLISNNIFSKILIASKGKKRAEIVYKEFE